MNQNIQTTQTEQFEVYRDGALDPTFKRKIVIKRTKQAMALVGAAGLAFVAQTAHNVDKAFTPVKLDIFDHVYGTNLRAQYFSGLRTQQILAAKRRYLA